LEGDGVGQALIRAIALEEVIRETRLAYILGLLERADALQQEIISGDGNGGVYTMAEVRAAVAEISVDSEYMTNVLAIKARFDRMAVDLFREGPPFRNGADLTRNFLDELEARQARYVKRS
jgi:hypothetical protein